MDLATLGLEVVDKSVKDGEKALKDFERQATNTEKATQKLKKETDNADKSYGKMSGTIGGLSRSLAPLAGAMAAAFGGRAVIGQLSEFEGAMAQVSAITRTTGALLGDMRQMAMDLGASTEFSATQAAEGFRFLGAAGFNAQQSIAALPSVLDLATAASIGLGEAADIASNIMGGFGIAAENAGSVADVMAATASRANTDVSQLGQAMKTAAPIAKGLGISLQETSAAIGKLSDAGIQGSLAGTQLRGVFASLAGPTKDAQDALAAYGLTAADIDPVNNDMLTILNRLGEANISVADNMRIFGREASSAAAVLVGARDDFGKLATTLKNVDGAAADMANTMRDNLGGDLKGLSSAISGVILAMGEQGLTAVLRGLVQGATSAFRFLSENMQMIKSLTIAAAGALTLYYASAMAGAIASTYTLIAGLVTLRGALVATGIGALVVGAGLLVNEFLKLSEKAGGFGQAMTLLGNVAKGVWSGIWNDTKVFGFRFAAFSLGIYSAFLDALNGMAQKFKEFISGVLDVLAKVPFIGDSVAGGINLAFDSLDAGAELTRAKVDSLNAAASRLAKEGFSEAKTAMQDLQSVLRGSSAFDIPDAPSGLAGLPAKKPKKKPSAPNGDSPVGGGDALDQMRSKLESLRSEFATAEQEAAIWYQSSLDTLVGAQALELVTMQEHADLKLQIEQEYQDRLAGIRLEQNNKNLQYTADFFGAAADIAQQGGEKTAKAARIFGAIQALINTYVAASQTLADPKLPFMAKLGAVGSVVAAGMGLVNAIRSGSTSASTGGGGASVASASQTSSVAATAPQNVSRPGDQTVNVYNSGAQVETRKRRDANGNQITDVIINTVNGGIAGGQFDKTMKGQYGSDVRTVTR